MSIQNLVFLSFGTVISIGILMSLLQHTSVWLGNRAKAFIFILINIAIISGIVFIQSIPIDTYILFRPLMYSLFLMLVTTVPYSFWGKIPSRYRIGAIIGSYLTYSYSNRLWFEFFDSLAPDLRELWVFRFKQFILGSFGLLLLFLIFLGIQMVRLHKASLK